MVVAMGSMNQVTVGLVEIAMLCWSYVIAVWNVVGNNGDV
jgi:hypothetical protein